MMILMPKGFTYNLERTVANILSEATANALRNAYTPDTVLLEI